MRPGAASTKHAMDGDPYQRINEHSPTFEYALPLSTIKCPTSMEFLASATFIEQGGQWHQYATCYDTLSMSALFNSDHVPDPLPTNWKWENVGGSVSGAGDMSAPSKGKLTIPAIRFNKCGTAVTITCSVIKLPKEVSLVIGSVNMMKERKDIAIDIIPDLANLRIYIISLHEVVRLDWLPRVLKRLKAAPINMLSFFGGLEPTIDVMMGLGFKIGQYISVEKDQYVRQMMSKRHPELTYVKALDIRDVTTAMYPNCEWYGITGGPPCQNSSRMNDNPKFDNNAKFKLKY